MNFTIFASLLILSDVLLLIGIYDVNRFRSNAHRALITTGFIVIFFLNNIAFIQSLVSPFVWTYSLVANPLATLILGVYLWGKNRRSILFLLPQILVAVCSGLLGFILLTVRIG